MNMSLEHFKGAGSRNLRRTSLPLGLLVLTLSSGLALFVAEALVRLISPEPGLLYADGLYIADEMTGYRHQPGYRGFLTNLVEYQTRLEINRHGLRGPEVGKRNGQTRVIVLGDSFIFGQGVEAEKSFAACLAAVLNQRGYSLEALNAGVRGYGTVQEAAWLQHYGMALAPDLVILGIYLGNDLQDNVTAPAQRLRMFSPPRAWHTPVTKWLYSHCHLYRKARVLWQRYAGNGRQAQLEWLRQNYSASSDSAPALKATQIALERMLQLANQEKCGLFAMLIPDPMQVEPSRQAAFAALAREHADWRLDLTYPNKVFATLLADLGIPYSDLTPAFQAQAARHEALYLPVDEHWNEAGHQLAAELVTSRLDALWHELPKSSLPVGSPVN